MYRSPIKYIIFTFIWYRYIYMYTHSYWYTKSQHMIWGISIFLFILREKTGSNRKKQIACFLSWIQYELLMKWGNETGDRISQGYFCCAGGKSKEIFLVTYKEFSIYSMTSPLLLAACKSTTCTWIYSKI